MSNNTFKGLEQLGFEIKDSINIYRRKQDKKKKLNDAQQRPIDKEKTFTYLRTFECPVCETEFKDRVVKVSGQQLKETKSDLRPIFEFFEPYKYDIVVCKRCGYAGLLKYFNIISQQQRIAILKNISTKYKSYDYPELYDVDTAIMRYKLALLNAVVKEGKDIEKAVICLKIKWLYSSKIDQALKDTEECKQIIKEMQLEKDEKDHCNEEHKDGNSKQEKKDYQKDINELEKQLHNLSIMIEKWEKEEKIFIKHCLKGLLEAYAVERFPSYGLDVNTVKYLIAEFYRLLGEKDKAMKWFSEIILTPNINIRLKDKAITQKDLMKKTKA